MISACACKMIPENFGVIASEKPDFDRAAAEAWIAENGEGYFIRDETSPYDCKYIDERTFRDLYMFDAGDIHSLFRRIVKL